MDDSTVVLCVGVHRGKRFPKTTEHALIVECSFHKIAQSSPAVLASSFPTFNAELRWEMTEKQMKEFRAKREPVKIQIYEVSGKNLNKTVLGSLVVYLRDVQTHEAREWLPLLHVKSTVRPELEISHRIVDKSVLTMGTGATNTTNSNNNTNSNEIKKNNKKTKPQQPKQTSASPNKPQGDYQTKPQPSAKPSNTPKPLKPSSSDYESDFELESDSDSDSDTLKSPRQHPLPRPRASPLPPPPQPSPQPTTYFSDPELNDRSLDIAFHFEYQDKQGVSQQQERLRKNEAIHLHEMVEGSPTTPPASPPLPKEPIPKNFAQSPKLKPPASPRHAMPHHAPSHIPPKRENPAYRQPDVMPHAQLPNFHHNFFEPPAAPIHQLHEDIEVPRDSPEYAAALMLAKWREKEQEMFKREMKVKEKQLLENLRTNWLKRETHIQTVMTKRDKDISAVASRIEKTLKRVEERERTVIKTEENVQAMRENLQKMYESKMVEVHLVCQRLRDDHAARVELEKTKMHELEIGEKILRDRLTAIDRRLHIADDEFIACRRKSDSVPVTKLQAEITNAKQEINDLHQTLAALTKETSDNKENLIRIYKEIARVKREHSEEVQSQLQREQQELIELRKQLQPMLAYN